MTASSATELPAPSRLPLLGLLALATASFVSILTEALPAGLLPQISRDLDVSEAAAGQLVTIYAIASLIVAIPVTAMTQGFRRKPLLLAAIAGFAVGNVVTSISNDYALTLAARFCAGAGAGLLWALLPGYASRMAPANLRGRAIAIAMVGVSVAMSIGVPAGTFVSQAIGWRGVFGILSAFALALIAWIAFGAPDFPGLPVGKRMSVARVFAIPGVRAVMMITLTFVLAHNILYTYIAPFVVPAGLGDRVDLVLLVFGLAALVGIWITGVLVDRWLRALILASGLVFAGAALALGLAGSDPAVVLVSIAAWGIAFGGCATLFQTALAIAAGDGADVAQSLLVVTWNCAISGGGVIGGILLNRAGVASFPWTLLPLLFISIVVAARTTSFRPEHSVASGRRPG
ncbi:MAG: MFS transporter [Verrucomicrobiota bacterium]